MEQQWHLSVCIVHARRLYAQIHIGAMNLRRERKTKRDFLPISNTVSTSCRSWKLNVIITFALCWGTLEIQWNLVITYPQGKWKKARTNQKYVLSKTRFSSQAGPVPRVHANDLPRKMLLRPECWSLPAFRTVKSPFRASWICKRARKLKSKLKGFGRHGRDQKKEPKKGQKVLLEGKMVCNIRFFCRVLYVLTEKKVHVFWLAMSVIDGGNVITECMY